MSQNLGRRGKVSNSATISKKSVFAAVAVLFALVVSLAFCEVMARLFAPPWLKQRMAVLNPDPSAGFGTDRGWTAVYRDGKFLSFIPFSRFNVTHVEYNNIANIDEFGGRRVSSRFASSSKLLPLLGDSMTFGVGVEDEQTFASKLAVQLPAFRILNLGIPGSFLDEQIQIIKLRHVQLNNPSHYIIFFFLGNDFENIVFDLRKATAFRESSSYGAKMDSSKKSFVQYCLNDFVYHHPILKKSFSIQLLRKFLLQLHNALRQANGSEPQQNPIFLIMDKRRTAYQAEAKKAAEFQLIELTKLQKKLAFTTMIIAIPDVHQLDDARRELAADGYGLPIDLLETFRPNQLLKNLVKKQAFEFFDSTGCLAKTQLGGRLYYQQDNHLRAVGHEALTRCVTAPIERFLNSTAVQSP